MINIYIKTGKRALLLASLLCAAMASAVSDPLLERLRSDHTAMVSAEKDFHSRRARGTLSGNEAADYAAYVAALHRRVAEDCVALMENGVPVPADLTCPAEPLPLIAPAAIDQATEQTGAETTALLEAELFAGLGEFDEMLLREQERVKAAAPRTAGGSGGAGGAGGGSDAEDFGDSEATSAESDSAGEPTTGQGAGPGSRQKSASSSAPPGTPDGSDDDVVARQLREAAEKETDPELKKKLWEEYRKYKQGTS